MRKSKIDKTVQLETLIKNMNNKFGYAYSCGYISSMFVSRATQLKTSELDCMIQQLERELAYAEKSV